MERWWSKEVKLSRRKFALYGAAAVSAGILSAIAGYNYDQILKSDSSTEAPLAPDSGEAESKIGIAWLPDTVKRWQPQIEKYSEEYGIDPNLMAIMMTVESGGDPNADSGVARGLMQITDPTAEDINNRLIDPGKRRDNPDLRDPDTNIELAAVYISHLIAEYGRNDHGPTWDETVTTVAAGYNGGYLAANLYRDEKWQGLEKYDSQTFNYARYVRTMWQERHDPRSFSYRHWYDTGNGKALVDNAAKYQTPQQ